MPALRKGEREILSEGKVTVKQFIVGGKNYGGGGGGPLTLTNKRLIYELEKGFISKRKETIADIPLHAIQKIEPEGLGLIGGKDIGIEFDAGYIKSSAAIGKSILREVEGLLARFRFSVDNAEIWEEKVNEAIAEGVR